MAMRVLYVKMDKLVEKKLERLLPRAASRYDGINFKPNELSGEIMVSLGFAVHKAPLNYNVLSLNVAELA